MQAEKKYTNMKPTEEQIKDIAEDLDCGFVCYYNFKTGEVVKVLSSEDLMMIDEEGWEEELDNLDENWGDFVEFRPFESYEAFQVMADFTEIVDDSALQERLINALNRPKPFQNFKWQIDHSGKYRQMWFDYKGERYIQWVKEQVEQEII